MGRVTLPAGFNPDTVRHWYLVANRAGAVIYAGTLNGTFHYMRRLKNPKARLTERELVADRPGRSFSSSRSGARHALAPRTRYHDEVAAAFARRIGRELEHAALAGEFSDLVILAEPKFLGMLNAELTGGVKSKVRKTVPREWRQGSDRELAQYIRGKLA